MFHVEIAGLGSFNIPTLLYSYDNHIFLQYIHYYKLQLQHSNLPTGIIKVSCYFILSEQVMLVAE